MDKYKFKVGDKIIAPYHSKTILPGVFTVESITQGTYGDVLTLKETKKHRLHEDNAELATPSKPPTCKSLLEKRKKCLI